MSRALARITHDEVVRMLKAARSAGVSIRSFSYDGTRVDIVVNNGEIGETTPAQAIQTPTLQSLIREPKL